jgi:hypothetical protein
MLHVEASGSSSGSILTTALTTTAVAVAVTTVAVAICVVRCLNSVSRAGQQFFGAVADGSEILRGAMGPGLAEQRGQLGSRTVQRLR